MKFEMSQVSEQRFSKPKEGNVYQSRGGRRGESPDYWIIVGISGNGVSMIGVRKSGEIVSATKYYTHVVEKWPLAGFCADVVGAKYKVEMF